VDTIAPEWEIPSMDTWSVVGASGLVGGRIVDSLAERGAGSAWVRKALPLPDGVQAVVSARIPDPGDRFWCSGALFVALGTTIRKAGSREAFEAVDLELVVECARRARAAGCHTLALVSAAGADSRSGIFYNRVKGKAEDAVLALGFPRVAIARPSLLLGDRAEFRFGEALARRILGPLRGLVPAVWRPVRDREVAATLVGAACDPSWKGVRILDNASLVRGG
jgi:uncharacterized protein YbjT (DUF2867 family)